MKLRGNPRSNNQLRDIIRSNKYNSVTISPTIIQKRNILRLKSYKFYKCRIFCYKFHRERLSLDRNEILKNISSWMNLSRAVVCELWCIVVEDDDGKGMVLYKLIICHLLINFSLQAAR